MRQRLRGEAGALADRSYTGHTPHLTIGGPLRSTRHAGGPAKIAGGFYRELRVFPLISAHLSAPASASRYAQSGAMPFRRA
jgi:hypothetical protein